MRFQNLSIKSQLAIGFGLLVAIVCIESTLSWMSLGEANERMSSYIHGLKARASTAGHIQAAVGRRAIAARNLVLMDNPSALSAEREAVMKAHREATESLAQLEKMVVSDPSVPQEARDLVAEISKVENKYGPVALAIVELAIKGERDEAIRRMNEECYPLLSDLIQATGNFSARSEARSLVLENEADQRYQEQTKELITGALLALVFSVIAGWVITRSITRPLSHAIEIADHIAQGDLTQTIERDPRADNETGHLLRALHSMQTQLAQTVQAVRTGADSVAIASGEISQGNHDLGARTETQASALEETAASMEEIGTTVQQNAEHARDAHQLAQSASVVARESGEAFSLVVETMHGIRSSGNRISDIIGVIDGIAFQTNILALNAAVEAARAGDQGRGFAVVAGEVRTLALRSAEASKEIHALITESVEQISRGTDLVDSAGAKVQELVDGIRKVAETVGEISTASVEQSNGVNQVAEAVSQMDQATQQNAALVEEMAAAATSLNHQAQDLVRSVSVFRLSGSATTEAQQGRLLALPTN